MGTSRLFGMLWYLRRIGGRTGTGEGTRVCEDEVEEQLMDEAVCIR